MTTTAAVHPFTAALLLPRAARPARPAPRRVPPPAAPAALWRQSLRVNSRRSPIERAVCIVLIVLAAAAIVYGVAMTVGTLSGDTLQHAVGRIAAGSTR